MSDSASPLLGRCKECDYAIFATREDVKNAETFKAVTAGTGVYRVGNNGFFARCSNGHKFFAVKAVKGTYSPDHKCDARCLNARGHDCTCSCGGANHGRGHAVTIVSAAELPAQREPASAPERTGKHLGEVGKHIRGEVTIKSVSASQYNARKRFEFISQGGDRIVWFVPTEHAPEWEAGKTLTIRAQVKRHESHERFGNSTIVTYVEEVE